LRLLAAALLVLSAAAAAWAGSPGRLDPEHTYAVIVGVLRWKDPSLQEYSPRNRKDQELADVLKARGVPAGHVRLLLDEEATREKVLAAVSEVAAKADEKATFLFYFAGHGHRNGDGVVLTNYDIVSGKSEETGLDAAAVGRLLAGKLKGGRVLLFADCCHSGGLSAAAKELKAVGRPAAVVASADVSCSSTGNWTFSQTLIDCLKGDPLADHDGDGDVTLAELDREVALAMKCREAQCSGRGNAGIDGRFVLAPAARAPAVAAGKFAAGDYVRARGDDGEQPARIVGRQGDRYVVQFYGYSDKRDKALPAEQLRPFEFPAVKVGQTVLHASEGKKWSAKVLEVQDDFCRVRYRRAGLPDEWVLSDRLFVSPTDAELKAADDKVFEVEWKGQWYPATVVREEKGKFYVHYVGYGPEWDEWVGKDRIREPKAP
jgi:hypothetical protein